MAFSLYIHRSNLLKTLLINIYDTLDHWHTEERKRANGTLGLLPVQLEAVMLPLQLGPKLGPSPSNLYNRPLMHGSNFDQITLISDQIRFGPIRSNLLRENIQLYNLIVY